jgi:tetratricopeptide (TPR) repeat protein
MPKVSWSSDVKGRVRRLIAELLSYVSDGRDDLKLCCKWEDEDNGKPKLVVDTQRRVLVKLAQFETNSQFYEAKNRLEDLKIYEERRIHTRGSENWRFALRLWSKDKATNLIKFDEAWENQRPEKSKRLSSRKPAPQKIQVSSATPCDKIPSNIPRSSVFDFVGRSQELEELHEKLHSCNRVAIVAIAGMGGVGKTELAIRYSQQHLKLRTYQGGICWLHPKRGDISVQIVEFAIAHFQNFTLPYRLTPVGQVEFCWQHWAEGQVLVVLDDVVDYRQVEDYLPPESLPRFKVLFTTREKLGTPLVRLDLNVLKPRAALALLKSLIGKERLKKEPWIARKLCNRLGYLPLGLELVGRYLAQDENLSLAEMLRRLERKRLRHKALESVESTMRVRLGVADAFELSWEHLDKAAQRLGCFMSFYALAPIPWKRIAIESLVSEEDLKFIKKQIEALEISQEDLDAFEEALEATEEAKNKLVRLSLLEPVADGFYRFHQLIRDFFQEKLEALPEANDLKTFFASWIATLARQFLKPLTSNEITAISPLIPHIAEVATQMRKLLTDEDFRFPFEALVYFYERQGLYYYAGDWCERYLAEVEARFGEEHIDTATIQRILAFLYKQQGQFTKAESLYLKALAFFKQNLGEQHPVVATTQNKLALVYCIQGRFQESESLFNQSLTTKQLMSEDADLGNSFNDLALLYLQQGRYREAESLLLKALELSENSKDKDSTGYATVLNNLGTAYQDQGRYSEAEVKFMQSLEVAKKLLEEHHPSFAGFQNNLASLYHLQGRYQEAESLYLKSLKILKSSLGKEHPDVISILNSLGNLYSEQKEYSKAEPFFVQALETRKHSLGENHPDYATSLNDLGLLYTEQGHYSKAKPLLLQAVEIRRRVLGESHPDYATNLNNLALLYLYQEHFDEVE